LGGGGTPYRGGDFGGEGESKGPADLENKEKDGLLLNRGGKRKKGGKTAEGGGVIQPTGGVRGHLHQNKGGLGWRSLGEKKEWGLFDKEKKRGRKGGG